VFSRGIAERGRHHAQFVRPGGRFAALVAHFVRCSLPGPAAARFPAAQNNPTVPRGVVLPAPRQSHQLQPETCA